MSGVQGLGQRAMVGRQGPEAAATTASFDALGMSVTPENVLGVHAVIQQEVQRLTDAVYKFKSDHAEGMPLLGGDPVSPYASRGFNEVTEQLLRGCQADIDDLQRLADGLAQAARDYGKTDADIAAELARVPPTGQLPGLLAGTDLPGPPPIHDAAELYRTGLR
jgi:uncharacterized protein YukE